MKPLTLYMRNFKSYGDKTPVFDFNSFDIVLLTGENGNGKSSIADAIAWCIWGQCKGMTGRSGIDDLVRTGADEMEVVFTFEEDENQYKIIRKRDKKRQQSSLDLFIEADGEFTPISGNTISETQSKIQHIIKLDYDTYLCTAYLSQGKADMFAVKRPNERKEVLAEILNLSSYDRLEELAQEERRLLKGDAEMLEREIKGLEDRLEDEEVTAKQLREVSAELDARQADDEEIGRRLEEKSRLYQEKRGLIKSLEGYRANLARVDREILRFKKEESGLTTKIQSYKLLLKREESITKEYKRARKLAEEESLYRERLQVRTEIMRQLESIENDIEKKRKEIEYNIGLIEQQIGIEKSKLGREADLSSEGDNIIKLLDNFKVLEEKIAAMEKQIENNTDDLASLKAEEKSLHRQIVELRERYKDLSGAESNCPTCRTPLSDDRRAGLLKAMAANGQDLQKSLKTTKKSIEDLQNTQLKLKQNIDSSKRKLKDRGKLETRLALIERELKEIDAAKAKLKSLELKLEPLEKNIEAGKYAADFLKAQSELKIQLDKLSYNEDVHKNIRKELKELENIGDAYQEVQVAKARLASYEESLERTTDLIRERKEYKRELVELVHELERLTGDIEDIKKDIATLEEDKRSVVDHINRLQSKRGALNERSKQIKAAKGQMEEKKQSLVELEEKIELYSILINVYGKKGIQAAIIENAIPELQDETNRILAKIADGQLTVEFLTQRDTKAGNTVETLDIKISDGLDTRKYETYSGGEEFRINFAIRIALSKILARRAGATVRMLVLDEGFGTLDERGRERLAQVINAISDEFEKIIVITHIQDLKEYFSNQIEVYMTPEGSMFKPL